MEVNLDPKPTGYSITRKKVVVRDGDMEWNLMKKDGLSWNNKCNNEDDQNESQNVLSKLLRLNS